MICANDTRGCLTVPRSQTGREWWNRGFALRLTCAVVSERHHTFCGTGAHQAAGNLAGPQPRIHDADIFAKVHLGLNMFS